MLAAAFHELEAGLEALNPEPGNQRDGHQQASQSKNVGDPADGVFLLFRDKNEQQRARQRREQNDRENVIMHKCSRRSSVFSRQLPCLLAHCVIENESYQPDDHHQRVPLHQAPLQPRAR